VPTSESHISTLLEPYVGPYRAKEPVKTMKEFKVPARQFDLDGCYKTTLDFINNPFSPEFDSTFFILPVVEPNSQPYGVPEEGWDPAAALHEGKYLALFPFALADDVSTSCADRTVVKHPEEEWDEEEDDSEWEEEENTFSLRMEDTGGFLVQIKDGHIIINSAVHYSGGCGGPMPSVDLEPDCRFLNEPMTRFIESFVRN